MGPFFLIFQQRDREDDLAWETCFKQLEGETKEQAEAEAMAWIKEVLQNAPECVRPLAIAELKALYDVKSGSFILEEDLPDYAEALAQVMRGDIDAALRTMGRISLRSFEKTHASQ